LRTPTKPPNIYPEPKKFILTKKGDWNAKNKHMNQAKKKHPAKTYTYFIHEIQSGKNEGDIVVKRYGNINTDDEIIESKKTPSEISIQQQLYNKGVIGIGNRTGIDYYAQTIELGRQGGKAKRI
jgi:hypothetical protein